MQSIDINKILVNEKMNVISSINLDNITLVKLMNELNHNHMIVTDRSIEKSKSQYVIHYNKDELVVLEKKNEKKRRFIYEDKKKLFIINQRRAQKNEIKEIIHRLSIYNKLLKNRQQKYLSDTQERTDTFEKDSIIKLVMSYSNILKLNEKKLYATNLSKNHELLLATYLKSFKNVVIKKINEKNKIKVINFFKEIVDCFVNNNDVIVISNIPHTEKKRGSTFYRMSLYKEKVVLIEKNSLSKNEFMIEFQHKFIKLNNNEIKDSALNWLLSKCIHISNDIESGKASVMQGIKTS